jgi:hypothetical protein
LVATPDQGKGGTGFSPTAALSLTLSLERTAFCWVNIGSSFAAAIISNRLLPTCTATCRIWKYSKKENRIRPIQWWNVSPDSAALYAMQGVPNKCKTMIVPLVSNRNVIGNFLNFTSSKSVNLNRRYSCFCEAKDRRQNESS